MRIVATRRLAGLGDFLLIDNSIIGSLAQTGDENLMVNPEEYPAVYKQYAPVRNKTEYVIRLAHEDKTVGFLNFEHQEEKAFGTFYAWYIRLFSRWAAPFVGALQIRYINTKEKETNIFRTVTSMLENCANLYGHHLNQPLMGMKLLTEGLLASVNTCQVPKEIRTTIEQDSGYLNERLEQISKLTDRFLSDLPSFLDQGAVSVNELWEHLESQIQSRREKIKITFRAKGVHRVFASNLLGEHFHNILMNAMQAIWRRRQDNANFPGRIGILVDEEGMVDEDQASTGLTFVRICVRDNGGGASLEILPLVGTNGFTTKENGSGYGLSAAREYAESFGGALQFRNFGKGFEVCMSLQKFDPDLHVQASPRPAQRMENAR